jgi:hypothetical protein
MWIGKDETGSFHDQFDVLCGLEQMINLMTWLNLRCFCFGTDEKECCHDVIWSVMWFGNMRPVDVTTNMNQYVD